MIPYIERDGEPTSPPDYSFPGMTVRSFLLPANFARLTSVCDTLLNVQPIEQCGFAFTPLAPLVVLAVLRYPRILSLTAPFSNGVSSQHELFFGFPVVRWDLLFPGDPLLSSLRAFGGCAMFYPYIFVDSPWSSFTGREVLGFPKLIARFNPPPPAATGSGFSFTTSTDVLATNTPSTHLQEQQFLAVASSGSTTTTSPTAILSNTIWPWAHFSPGAIGFVPAGVQGILDQFIPSFQFSTVQLKQFREAASGSTAACYQAIVQDVFAVSSVKVTALPQATITLPRFASLDIAATLGIPLGSGSIANSINQLEATFNMECMDVSNLISLS
jgi:hypothetical protein